MKLFVPLYKVSFLSSCSNWQIEQSEPILLFGFFSQRKLPEIEGSQKLVFSEGLLGDNLNLRDLRYSGIPILRHLCCRLESDQNTSCTYQNIVSSPLQCFVSNVTVYKNKLTRKSRKNIDLAK